MGTVDTPFSRSSYLAQFIVLDAITEADAAPLSTALTGMEPWRTLGYSGSTVAAYILRHDPTLHRYIMRIDGAFAGAIFVRYPWLFGPYIELFSVFPAHQGCGAGRAIVQWIEEVSQNTARNIWALVSSFNTAARHFYRRVGFIEVAPLTDLVRHGCDEILIRKELKVRRP